jgi:hypothetical protein
MVVCYVIARKDKRVPRLVDKFKINMDGKTVNGSPTR